MHILGESDIKAHIKNKTSYHTYFIFGNEHYLIKYYVKRLIEGAASENPDFNLNEFDSGSSVQDIYDAADSLPFMSDKKCVAVCDINFDKLSQNEFSKLIELVESPSESTVLLFFFDVVEINAKRLTERAKKLMNAIEKSGGCIVELFRKSTSELIKMLCEGATRRDCRMEPTTARYLIENCSDDLTTLINELEKLTAYCREKGIITNADVDKICPKSIEVSIFNLSKMLLSKNLQGAYKIIDDLFYMRTEPVMILSILSSTYVDMYRAKTANENGVRPDSLAKELGYTQKTAFKLTNADRDSRNLSKKQLTLSLNELLSCDKRLKSTRADSRILIEELMTKLVYIASKGVSL